MDIKLRDSRESTECGCPEEDWEMGMFDVTIHMEPDGSGEAFLDNGDWQDELHFQCSHIGELRLKVADHIRDLPAATE